MFSTSIIFGVLMDACLVKPFTRWVDTRVPMYVEQRQADPHNDNTSQVMPAILGQPARHSAEACDTKDVARESVRLARHASRDSVGVQQLSILDPSRSGSGKSLFDPSIVNRELVASIMQLERNLFLATHGTTELDHPDAIVDEDEVEVAIRSNTGASQTASIASGDARDIEEQAGAIADI